MVRAGCTSQIIFEINEQLAIVQQNQNKFFLQKRIEIFRNVLLLLHVTKFWTIIFHPYAIIDEMLRISGASQEFKIIFCMNLTCIAN